MTSMSIGVASARYVRIKLAEALTGLTVDAIEQKIKSGTWLEGKQYRRKGREIYIDMKGYEQWVEEDLAVSK
jgi:hypothetical protein